MAKKVTLVNEQTYEEIMVGDTAEVVKTITEADVINFAGLVGDFNPLHVDREYAEKTRFGQRIVHGMLTASFLSTIVGACIPGRNALYLSQEVKFVKPVFIGDTIRVRAEVVEKIDRQQRVILKTDIYNQRGELVVTGRGVTMVREE